MARDRLLPKWACCLLLSLACSGLAALFAQLQLTRQLESRTIDYRFRLLSNRPTASSDIVLVEIDDYSLRFLESENGRWPWPRDTYVVLLEFLREARARLVIFDIGFWERDVQNPEADEEFARATREHGKVVHAVFLGEQKATKPDAALVERTTLAGCSPFLGFIELLPPLEKLADSALALGHVAMTLDPDGPWRRSLPLACYGDRLVPSLPLAALLASQGAMPADVRVKGREITVGTVRVPLDNDHRLPIWFNGPPGSYRKYSFANLFYSGLQLAEGERPEIDPADFRDKVVFVGVTAAASHDLFTTPYSGGSSSGFEDSKRPGNVGKMAGTEVQAHIYDSLVHQRFLRSFPAWLTGMIVLLAACLTVTAILYLPLWPALGGLVLVPLSYLFLSQRLFAERWQLPVVVVVLAWSLALVAGFVYQYWIEGAEKRKVKQIFSHYVSRDVFHELLNNPSAVTLGGKRAVATVLFSDLRGFSTLSEKTEPEVLIAQLNEYFSAMVEVVFAHRGTIDKFVGDMIMALFNAPLADQDHADHAVRCAIGMQRRLEELNEQWRSQARLEFRSGVGINSGEMIVGNVGAESIRSYTVIGDNVNLGSRLESLCKEHRTEIIISEQTRELLKESYRLEEIGEVTVKGKTKPVRVFAVDWRRSDRRY
jgi:adenylate cyclase